MSSTANPLELAEDAKYEYLILEEEEDIYSNTSDSDNDTTNLSEQNAQDFFYLIRHNKKKYIKERLNSSFPLKVNTTNNTRLTPVMSATIFRRHGILRTLLSRPEIRVNSQDEHQMTALLYAASNGDQRCLKYLLNAKATPAQFNTERRNVLHLLILRRHFNSVLYLLEYPEEEVRNSIHALINTPDAFGMTPLLYACEFGQRNLAKYLIQCGADSSHHDNVGRDALCHAIQSKSLSLVQFFLAELGFNVNRVYERCNGFTPLFYAAMTDSPQLIMELLRFGAQIDNVDQTYGETPFLYACRHCKLDSIFALLFCGANPKAKNNVGTTALLYLVKHGLREEMSYVFGVQLGHILPISPFNPQGVYEAASRMDIEELYTHLRKLQDDNGYTSLIHAVLGDNSDAVKFLLEVVKCDIRSGDNHKRSALYHAVANRFVQLFELLIEAGADFNTRDQNNNTVLMHAVDSNNPSFVQSLIQRGADMTVLNHEKWSALTYTCKTGNFDLFRILIEEIRHRYPNPTETCALFTAEHLSLCLNVACVFGRPALGASTTNLNSRQHALIVGIIVARNKAVTANLSGSELLRQCQFADPNMVFPGLEPCILAAVRNSGDNTSIIEYLFASPNAVSVRARDDQGYTPTLLAVRLHCHNVIRVILVYEGAKTQAIGVSAAQSAASAELRCPKDLTPADHACIIRHDKTFTEVRKRSRAIPQQKANAFKVSSGELLALGESFEGYLLHMYKIALPYVEYISTGSAVSQVTPQLPITFASQENELVLQEIDHVWLSEQSETHSRQGFSIGASLFELVIPEQSTYRPKTIVQGSVLTQPFIPRELLDEMEMYSQFIKSASIVEQILEFPNTSRPATSALIPTYAQECKSLFYVAVAASKNLALLLALLQCNFSQAGSAKPGDLGGFGGAGNEESPGDETGSQTPSGLSHPVSRPGMPASRPGMPASRPGMPVSRPGMPASRPGMPVSRPGMPASRPGMPTSPSTPATSTMSSPTIRGGAQYLRPDNIDNHNNTLLQMLFAFAGYAGASVSGTQFLLTAIICAKYSPFWDTNYIFVGHGGKYNEKRGKNIAQLAKDYNIPAALELAQKPLFEIEQQAKQNRKKTGL